MQTEALTAGRHRALLAYFDQPDQGFCFCGFWFFEGTTEAWLRCDPQRNREALTRALSRDEVWGIVALREDRVIGWARLAPTSEVRKLSDLEPDPPDDAASLLCMSVSEDSRGGGVARALLAAAIGEARSRGYAQLRAYPRPEEGLEAGEVWTGPRRLLEAHGWNEVQQGPKRWTFAKALR
jgi:GNAT superfamily N-acetyltransferase